MTTLKPEDHERLAMELVTFAKDELQRRKKAPILMSPSGKGRKSLAFRRSLEVKHPCAEVPNDESHEIRSQVPLGLDHKIPPGGAGWGGGDAGARTGAGNL
jgi:hypothetical protein